jgi:SAM-dependent methyltransferase
MTPSEPVFAQLFDAHHSNYYEDLIFWKGLAELYGDPVLELGCGSGRVLIPLARDGHRVFGLDRDFAMLQLVRTHTPPALTGLVNLFQADLRDFHLNTHFPLILFPCNMLSTLFDETRREVLIVLREHLSLGGVFSASMPNPALLARLPARGEPEIDEFISHPITGNVVQVSCEWQRTDQSFRLSWHYDHLLLDGRVQRVTSMAEHNLASIDIYLADLRNAGMRPIATYGDFDGAEYTEKSPHLILVAERSW